MFAKLKSVAFNGPIMVEGVKVGTTAEETTANARANRKFLERLYLPFEAVHKGMSDRRSPATTPQWREERSAAKAVCATLRHHAIDVAFMQRDP